MESIEKTLQWFLENEKLFKDQENHINELKSTISHLTKLDEEKKKFEEYLTSTITKLDEDKKELLNRALFAEERLTTLINLLHLNMY
jgi:tRNA A37 threonylcarbamoyladenosine synthetase subunit TsaC/SUA5/YrdC